MSKLAIAGFFAAFLAFTLLFSYPEGRDDIPSPMFSAKPQQHRCGREKPKTCETFHAALSYSSAMDEISVDTASSAHSTHCSSVCGTVSSAVRIITPAGQPDDLFLCSSCRHVFRAPSLANHEHVPNPDTYLRSFAGISSYEYHFSLVEATLRCKGRLQPEHDVRLFEIGSALGFFLATARCRGWVALGSEQWKPWWQFSKDYLQVDSYLGSPETVLRRIPVNADVVYLSQVLEHVDDPVQFLRIAGSALTRGGVLFLSVPNFDSATRRSEGYGVDYVSNTLHLQLFTVNSLATTLRSAGFSDVEVGCVGDSEWELLAAGVWQGGSVREPAN
mmetsp:Transcript_27643/g.88907  ORF Transcript_27643/g.88907 Transcript_27643/m.88907 type:complete len:332 (-) Transcript_27643:434-1429(-)